MLDKVKDRNFSFHKKLHNDEFFSYVDIFFAVQLNPKSEEEAIFLSYLFLISRSGYISLLINEKIIYPSPKSLILEDNIQIDEQTLIEKIIAGSKKISKDIYYEDANDDFPKFPICKYQNYYYLQKNFVFETRIVKRIKNLLLQKPKENFSKDAFLDYLQNEKTLNVEQKQALQKAFEHSISYILGGPGCGKTYVAAHLMRLFSQTYIEKDKKELKIVASSFTGKATSHLKAKIIQIAKDVKVDAKTLHSLLNLKEGRNKFFDHEQIDYDLIIIDEASMIDIKLMAYLLDAIKDGTRIVFIGDPNQLPPIEGGNIFLELSRSNLLPNTFLKSAIRFDNNVILDLANTIRDEKSDQLDQILSKKVDFYDVVEIGALKTKIHEMSNEYYFQPTLKDLEIKNLLENINVFRILSSIRKGSLGTETLNKEIFFSFFKKAQLNQNLYVPIIITKNNYKLDLYNGQMGIAHFKISQDGLDKGVAYFHNEDGIVDFPIYSLRFYEYAYAISIHKSQGSEFQRAFVIIPEASQNFGKELFYTAITRTKNELILGSSKRLLAELIKKSSAKKSALLLRLSADSFTKNVSKT